MHVLSMNVYYVLVYINMCSLCFQILTNVHLMVTMTVNKSASMHLVHMDASVTQAINSMRMEKLVSVSTGQLYTTFHENKSSCYFHILFSIFILLLLCFTTALMNILIQ